MERVAFSKFGSVDVASQIIFCAPCFFQAVQKNKITHDQFYYSYFYYKVSLNLKDFKVYAYTEKNFQK